MAPGPTTQAPDFHMLSPGDQPGSLSKLQPVDTLRTKNKLPGVSETWIGQQEKLSPNLFANQTNQVIVLISSDPNNFNLGVCEKSCRVLLICHCSLLIYLSSNTHPRKHIIYEIIHCRLLKHSERLKECTKSKTNTKFGISVQN